MGTGVETFELRPAHFDRVKTLLYGVCGIDLRPGKESLVRARLAKRLRALSIDDFGTYLDYIEHDRQELDTMVDALTTNKTSFFREQQHFDFLIQRILPALKGKGSLRMWSAACSSGEEPFSIGIALREALPDIDRMDVRILATDISRDVLEKARRAVYRQEILEGIPAPILKKYFTRVETGPPRMYRVNDSVKAMVRLARLNLMGTWPMKGPFDVIFCRNVMIYFDKSTRERLVQRFYGLLGPGGYLLIGHSESLTGSSHRFSYVQPAIYRK